jgi:hypothetical protein
VISIPGELAQADRTGLSLWQRAALRSAILRKGGDYARQLPRAIVRFRARDEDYRWLPPVLANSFPKSGTNLLLQILCAFAHRCFLPRCQA